MMKNAMTTKELDAYFKNLLDIESYTACDSSLNGIQADNDGAESIFLQNNCLINIPSNHSY
jgi:hypothetical protein